VRLGVSALPIHTPGGIGRYARILASVLLTRFEGELHLFLQRREDLQLILQELPHHEASNFQPSGRTVLHLSKFPYLPRQVLHQMEVPRVFAGLKLDAYLSPDYVLPPIAGAAMSCVAFDTTPFAAPHLLGVRARLIYGVLAPRALAAAHRVICISERTREGLTRLFPDFAPKLRVVHPCLAPSFSAAAEEGYQHVGLVNVRTEYGIQGIPHPFILHVGVPGPRKNLDVLLRAFRELKLRMLPHRLVFVGGRAVPPPKQDKPITEAALPGGSTLTGTASLPEVLHLGRIADSDLITLYRHADLLVLPSLDEGFGYPVLEALCFRTPALVSANSPLAHLPGVAAASDVQSPLALAADLEEALRNLSELSSQLSAGFTRREYSCERFLEKLLDALS